MLVSEQVCDAAIFLAATQRMAQIDAILSAPPDDADIAALQAERAALDGSWISIRMVDIPGIVTAAQQLAIDQANAAAELTATTNVKTMDTMADQALANLRAYRDLAGPTQAQTVAVVKLLCRVAIALIRFRLAKFDGTD